jgi:hypothetical protein
MVEFNTKVTNDSTTTSKDENKVIASSLTLIPDSKNNIIVSVGEQRHILWNIVNCFIASLLVILGSFSNGVISKEAIIFALIVGGIAFFTQFKSFWAGEQKVFQFL